MIIRLIKRMGNTKRYVWVIITKENKIIETFRYACSAIRMLPYYKNKYYMKELRIERGNIEVKKGKKGGEK